MNDYAFDIDTRFIYLLLVKTTKLEKNVYVIALNNECIEHSEAKYSIYETSIK